MSKTFKFEVVTSTGKFYADQVDYVSFMAINGEMGVMADHEPMLVANKPCTLVIDKDGKRKYAFISEGFIEITSEKVSIVVDLADWSDDINAEEAIKAKRIAEEMLESRELDLERQLELIASIERASARIKTSKMRGNT